MDTPAFRRHALRPKPVWERRCFTIPPFGTVDHAAAVLALRQATPAERRALSAIVENADLVEIDGAPPHLLVEVTPELVDALAAFDAEAEDMEPGGEDDEATGDDEPDHDNEPESDDEHELQGFCNPMVNTIVPTAEERLRPAGLQRAGAP